jgi:hypothetical protein
MRQFWISILQVAITLVVAATGVPLSGQVTSEWTQSKLIRAKIAMQDNKVPLGKVPWLVLTVQNLSDYPLHDNDIDIAYRVTVLQNNKEALRTRLHRQLRHEPGVPDIEFS